MPCSRNEFLIAFNGQIPRFFAQFEQQSGDRSSLGNSPRLAVDGQFNFQCLHPEKPRTASLGGLTKRVKEPLSSFNLHLQSDLQKSDTSSSPLSRCVDLSDWNSDLCLLSC